MTKFLFIFLILLLFLGFFLWQGIYLPEDSTGQEKLFSVERGQNVFQIGENLEKEGLIKSRFFFNFYVLAKGVQKRLQAGKYSLNSSMNISEIAKKIISGDTTKIVVTIPEGFTVKQIEEKLNLKLPGENLEGFLFPDTYYLSIDVSGKELVEKMRENFEKKLNTEIPELGLTVKEAAIKQEKTIFEIVTMASLLEKEVKAEEDKKLVSGILWKRLEKGMPLQVDATISYITGKKTTKISIEETQIDSPYNTYKYLGLPMGPICNPGLDSILAALYPKDSDYWYYLTNFTTPERETIFSKTLEEHNLAKAKYPTLVFMAEKFLENKKIAMIIAFRDFRDAEYFVPKEILEKIGVRVKTASNKKGTAIGADGGDVEVDLLVSETNPVDFDAVIFVGGPGALDALDNEDSYKLARETVSQNKVLASICISPVILAKAGVLEGKKATVWSSALDRSPVKTLQNYGAVYQDQPVVVDGKIITANGPGASEKFGQAIVEVLTRK